MSQPVRVGIIGVGEMGRPLLHRLLAAGHHVAALIRRAELRAELAAAGAEMVDSIEGLAKGREIVILFVFTDEQVRKIALDDSLVDAMEPGSILVVHTTGSPRTVEAIATHAAARGVLVVDAPVSGGPSKISAGNITLLVGGKADDVERCRPVFACYANPVLHVGTLGMGQRVKLINNLMFGAHIQLAIEAARLGRTFGIDAGELARILGHCSGNSAALEIVAMMGSPEVLMARAGRFVHKDVLVASRLADELGAELGLLATVTAPLLEAPET
jgi:3-hydroxyisobutyrate dehydrogenase-like beta-hydroxyacid dehydrogenase